jgi:heme/copper-type cytochrome/quinol oxidase subunit 4
MRQPVKSNASVSKHLLLIAGVFVVIYPLFLWLIFFLPMRQLGENPLPIAYVVFALPVVIGLLVLLLAAKKKLKVPPLQEIESSIRILLVIPAAGLGYFLTAHFLPSSLPIIWREVAFHLAVALLAAAFWIAMIKLLDLLKKRKMS